jgi:hypothetical protein
MLHIHSTKKLATAIGTGLEISDAEEGSWIEHWYANIVPIAENVDVVLATNATTLFSLVVPIPRGGISYAVVVDQLQKRIAGAMSAHGLLSVQIGIVSATLEQYLICKTISRSVLGSMNDIAAGAKIYADRMATNGSPLDVYELEVSLNNTPLKPLGYRFPVERFSEQLRLLR